MPDSLSTLLVIFAAIILLFALAPLVMWAASMINPTRRRVEDISAVAPPVPGPVRDAASVLESLGFAALGVTRTHMPGAAGITWYLAGQDGTVMAEVVEYNKGAAVQFTTQFEDGCVVETSTPIGERIRSPRFWTTRAEGGIVEAYEQHQRERTAFLGQVTSVPRRFATIAQVLEAEHIYREQHFRRKMLPGLLRQLTTLGGIMLGAAGAAASMFTPPLWVPRAVWTVGSAVLMLLGLGLMLRAQVHVRRAAGQASGRKLR